MARMVAYWWCYCFENGIAFEAGRRLAKLDLWRYRMERSHGWMTRMGDRQRVAPFGLDRNWQDGLYDEHLGVPIRLVGMECDSSWLGWAVMECCGSQPSRPKVPRLSASSCEVRCQSHSSLAGRQQQLWRMGDGDGGGGGVD